MHAGPRPVQTEVNATRILLPGPDGRSRPLRKALANGLIFLLLAAGLASLKRAGEWIGNLANG